MKIRPLFNFFYLPGLMFEDRSIVIKALISRTILAEAFMASKFLWYTVDTIAKRGEILAKNHFGILNWLSKILFMKMDFKNRLEFERKSLLLCLQRGKIFNWVVFALSFYSFYLDFTLYQDPSVDRLYRRNLLGMHILIFLLSIAYLAGYKLLEGKNRQTSPTAKALILSEICLILFFASALSLNSQRFTGNLDAYIMVLLVAALMVPIYPKWVLLIYSVNHVLFLVGLSSFFGTGNSIVIKQFNSTFTVLVAMILFLLLYRYNVTNFLNEEMLREDKQTFIKLFEGNPFPLLISRFEDGKIQYANHKAVLFYELPEEISGALNHAHLYKKVWDFDSIRKRLETDGKVVDYLAAQRTCSGQTKYAVVNYELIDYFGEKSILSGVSDIEEVKRIEEELTVHASTDPLTGVLNRRAGMDLLTMRFEAAHHGETGFTLCFFDADNLKTVNDTFGHLEGDVLIVNICRIIMGELHPDDIIFRYGGDEFILLFENNCEQEARKTCARIMQRFEALNQSKQKPYQIAASFGVFSYSPEMNLSLERVIEMADKDMYHNKAQKQGL